MAGLPTNSLRDLAGIGLVARHILARQIEDAPHIGLFLRRHARRPQEGGEFRLGDHAVGLGHFSGQRDHRDGEDHAGIGFAVENEMAGHRAHQRADGPPTSKPGAPRR